ncbi:hypothetical protein DFH07DRAFT_783935 [Mycena maculata]|uniref:Uncharacterized protein n=1 Tax=Mycena maculata TaxID=230809 RepID=A0AAD7HJG3_9AGAR|nr:hypothetical protein DFH07DRAFT_783935 [Mycena maculata]
MGMTSGRLSAGLDCVLTDWIISRVLAEEGVDTWCVASAPPPYTPHHNPTLMAEILRSGQEWQAIRRRAREAKAAAILRAAARAQNPEILSPMLSDGATIVTFIPGQATPITSIQQPNGKVIPMSGLPPHSTARYRGPPGPGAYRLRPPGTNSISVCRARDEAIFLARFAASREKHHREEEVEAARPQKKKKCWFDIHWMVAPCLLAINSGTIWCWLLYLLTVMAMARSYDSTKKQFLVAHSAEYLLARKTGQTRQFRAVVLQRYVRSFGFTGLMEPWRGPGFGHHDDNDQFEVSAEEAECRALVLQVLRWVRFCFGSGVWEILIQILKNIRNWYEWAHRNL